MKMIRIMTALVKTIVMNNKITIASAITTKLSSDEALNELMKALEAMEDELKEISFFQLVLFVALMLVIAMTAALAVIVLADAGMLFAGTMNVFAEAVETAAMAIRTICGRITGYLFTRPAHSPAMEQDANRSLPAQRPVAFI